MFVDNVKSGSTTIRQRMDEALNLNWDYTDALCGKGRIVSRHDYHRKKRRRERMDDDDDNAGKKRRKRKRRREPMHDDAADDVGEYVDKVKQPCTTLEESIWKECRTCWNLCKTRGLCERCRPASTCFSESDVTDLFQFGIVRDPVKKFESGVRQAWFDVPSLRNMSADMAMFQTIKTGTFLNHHFQPSTWRFTGSLLQSNTRPRIDFIAKLERFDEDLQVIVNHTTGLTASQRRAFGERLTPRNVREDFVKHGVSSLLSPTAIRLMCRSAIYKDEWACFGYDLPQECSQ